MRIVFVFILTSLFQGSLAFACDRTNLDAPDAYNEADIVFRGSVQNIRYLDDSGATDVEPRVIVTFDVINAWKGPVEKVLAIHTTHNKFTCNGYAFEAGKEYLVYSRYNRRADSFFARLFAPDHPTLGVKVYGGTKPIAEANKELEYLEKRKTTFTNPARSTR